MNFRRKYLLQMVILVLLNILTDFMLTDFILTDFILTDFPYDTCLSN